MLLSEWQVGQLLWSMLCFLGVVAYLAVRGHKIAEHRMTDAERTDQAMQAYIRSSTTTPADDLGTLVDLHDRGVIDDAEFESMRQRLVSP
jgi:Short C-terminal domain